MIFLLQDHILVYFCVFTVGFCLGCFLLCLQLSWMIIGCRSNRKQQKWPAPLFHWIWSQITDNSKNIFNTEIMCKKAFSNLCLLNQTMKTSRCYLNSTLASRKGCSDYVQSQTYLSQPQLNSCRSSLMREPRKEKNAPGAVPQAQEPSGISTVRENLNWKLEKLPSIPSKKKY